MSYTMHIRCEGWGCLCRMQPSPVNSRRKTLSVSSQQLQSPSLRKLSLNVEKSMYERLEKEYGRVATLNKTVDSLKTRASAACITPAAQHSALRSNPQRGRYADKTNEVTLKLPVVNLAAPEESLCDLSAMEVASIRGTPQQVKVELKYSESCGGNSNSSSNASLRTGINSILAMRQQAFLKYKNDSASEIRSETEEAQMLRRSLAEVSWVENRTRVLESQRESVLRSLRMQTERDRAHQWQQNSVRSRQRTLLPHTRAPPQTKDDRSVFVYAHNL